MPLGVGVVTEGFAGQTTMTKLGLVSGWYSSILSWSPLRVMGPLASTVGDDGDTVPPGASRPWGALPTRTMAA
jgi:hypothetical protein